MKTDFFFFFSLVMVVVMWELLWMLAQGGGRNVMYGLGRDYA